MGREKLKVKDLDRQLYFGDVIVMSYEYETFVGYSEMLVTWIRIKSQHGPLDENDPDDFDVQLLNNNGEICTIRNMASLDDCEFVHNAFLKGAWTKAKKDKNND